MNKYQKGLTPILIIGLIVFILLVSGGIGYFLLNKNIDKTIDWRTYQWNNLEFKYPSTWTVEKTYYSTAAQQVQGQTPENIGLDIFPGKEIKGKDFIAIGGHQVSCEASQNHTKCSFINSIANFIYTDSNNSEILNIFDQIVSTFKFTNAIDGIDQEQKVVIFTDKTNYKQGEVVKITVKNNLDRNIGYYDHSGECNPQFTIQNFINGKWKDVRNNLNNCKSICACKSPCTTYSNGWVTLESGAVIADGTTWDTGEDCISAAADKGKYRALFDYDDYSIDITAPGKSSEVYSNEFVIE